VDCVHLTSISQVCERPICSTGAVGGVGSVLASVVAVTALLGWEKFQPASRARTVKVYAVVGARPTTVADVAPVKTTFPARGLTDTWYRSMMPELSVEASQESET
jgi:hypothetical protein